MKIRVLLAAIVVVAACAPASPPPEARDWRDETIYFVMTDRFRNGDPSNDRDAAPGHLTTWQGGDLQSPWKLVRFQPSSL